MNAQELAQLLNGREYGWEITADEEAQAKEAGLVVVFGYSDDNMEFRGAINDEVGCYNGGTAYLTPAGLLTNECEHGECPYFEKLLKAAIPLQAVYDSGDALWSYNAPFKHSVFAIVEGGGVYCRGIVFALSDIAVTAP